jgi:glycosyltransferase involved in cell wall biosynthesis
MEALVFISVIIPCRNENNFIGKCLDSIILNDYPKDKFEILVVDGMSSDGTREIVRQYLRRYPFVKLLDNPKKITPVALNLGIKAARGEIIVRMDAHAEYPMHYLSKCLEYLFLTKADVVGGPIITVPPTDRFIAKCIALLISHPFGVGNSRFRTSREKEYVDTVPFGAYRKDVFNRFGLFDERLVRNQDNEMSSRIIKNKGKIYSDPDLIVRYYSQATIGGLLRQAFRTGMWNITTFKINPSAFRWRHFVPLFFVVTFLTLGFLSIFNFLAFWVFIFLFCLYSIMAIISSISMRAQAGIRYILPMPLIFFLYHMCYGVGSLAGMKVIFQRPVKELSREGNCS